MELVVYHRSYGAHIFDAVWKLVDDLSKKLSLFVFTISLVEIWENWLLLFTSGLFQKGVNVSEF